MSVPESDTPTGPTYKLGAVPLEVEEAQINESRAPADGLPPPVVLADVENIGVLYKASKDYLESARDKLANGLKNADIDWEASLYTLFAAWIVNYGRDPNLIPAGAPGGVSTSPTALPDLQTGVPHDKQPDNFVHRAAQYFDLEWKPFIDLALAPFSSHKTPASGPYGGVFIHKGEKPFLILSFKGTTYPKEITTDALANAVAPPDPVLWGNLTHQGMAQGLFSPFTYVGYSKPAFDIIWNGIVAVAEKLKGNTDRKVPLYVTGHSLGAGYATQAYGELLRLTRANAPASFELLDLWVYGSPRLFVNDGVSKIKSETAAASVHVWRPANYKDYVPNFPIFDLAYHLYKHLDIGYRIFPEADESKYLEVRKTEVGVGHPYQNDGYPPGTTAEQWKYHWPQRYYDAIVKVIVSTASSSK